MKKWLAIALWASGCGGSGKPAVKDQPAVFVQSNTQDASTITAADFSCLGTFKDPAAPAAVTPVMMTVADFEKSTPVSGATVQVFTSLADFNAMNVATSAGPSGADGVVTVMMPAGAYRVIFRVTADPQLTIETVEFNRVWNDPKRISVSQATKGEIPGLVSVVPDDTKGVVAGDLRDCNGNKVGGALFDVAVSGGAYDSAANTFYFVDFNATTTVPQLAQKWTSGDGVFASLNVPTGDATLTVTGLLTAGGASTRLGTGVAPVRANSVTVVQLAPLGI
jgi:hypothetical protein